MTDLYVSLPRMTFALLFQGGRCVDAPPIARWCIGKDYHYLVRYWAGRVAHLEEL